MGHHREPALVVRRDMPDPRSGAPATRGTYDAFLNSVHAEDRETVGKALGKAMTEGHPVSLQHRIVCPDGEVRIVQDQAEAFRDERGRIVRVAGTIQDITERKQAERPLERRQQALESIYHIATRTGSTTDALCEETAKEIARVLNASGVVVRHLGHTRCAIGSGRVGGEPCRNGATQEGCGPCAVVRSKGTSYQCQGLLRQMYPQSGCFADHDFRAYLGVPLKNGRGEVIGVLCVLHHPERVYGEDTLRLLEIFGRYIANELEQEARERQQQISQRLQWLGELTSGVAHEVRNPLNTIMAMADALQEDLEKSHECRE